MAKKYNISTRGTKFNTEEVAEYIANIQDIPYTRIERDNYFPGHDVWNDKDAQFSVHREGDEFEVISQKVQIPIEPIIKLEAALKSRKL